MAKELDLTAATPRLGQAVTYRDRHGRAKVALVTATPDTMPEDDAKTGIKAPEPGEAHLLVLSFTGTVYAKHSVPEGDGPTTFTVIP